MNGSLSLYKIDNEFLKDLNEESKLLISSDVKYACIDETSVWYIKQTGEEMLLSGHNVIPLEGEELEKQTRNFKGYAAGMVRLEPGGWVFPVGFVQHANDIFRFKFFEDDVLVITWPKCGTTWTQEIVWNMRNNPDLKENENTTIPILMRSPFLEFDFLTELKGKQVETPALKAFKENCPNFDSGRGVHIQFAENFPRPRTLKTHLSLSLLPKNVLNIAKVVCVIRDPRDACVSYYHHSRLIKGHDFVGSFEDFVNFFMEGSLIYGAYEEFLKEIWEVKDHSNLKIISYENLKNEPFRELLKLNKFLDTKLTEKQLEKIIEYTSFERMKSKSTLIDSRVTNFFNLDVLQNEGGFFWKGQVGNYKIYMSHEVQKRFDDWKLEKLKKQGINFEFPTN